MAYTICDQWGNPNPLRLIVPNVHGVPELKAPFTPCWWTCDPCNPTDNRFEIIYRSDQEKPQYFPWYQVVTSDDTDEDVQIKIDHYVRVLAARKSMDEAAREYRRLTGCGWSVIPQA